MVSNVLVWLVLFAVGVLLGIAGWKFVKSISRRMDPWQLVPRVEQASPPAQTFAEHGTLPMPPPAVGMGKVPGFYPTGSLPTPGLPYIRRRMAVPRTTLHQAESSPRQPIFVGGTTGYKYGAPCWICGRPRSECKKH